MQPQLRTVLCGVSGAFLPAQYVQRYAEFDTKIGYHAVSARMRAVELKHRTASGLSEANSFKLCGHGWRAQRGAILLLSFGWRDVTDGLRKPPVVEPVEPFQGSEFHRLEAAPRSVPVDDPNLAKTVDRFGESVVLAVTDDFDRKLDACFYQPMMR